MWYPIWSRAFADSRATSNPQTWARPRVGINKVVRIRSKVDLPAPLAPISASMSPDLTWKEIPRRAGTVSRETGCNRARHPLDAAGKYFSRFSTHSEGSFTRRSYILSNVMKQGPGAGRKYIIPHFDCGRRCRPNAKRERRTSFLEGYDSLTSKVSQYIFGTNSLMSLLDGRLTRISSRIGNRNS